MILNPKSGMIFFLFWHDPEFNLQYNFFCSDMILNPMSEMIFLLCFAILSESRDLKLTSHQQVGTSVNSLFQLTGTEDQTDDPWTAVPALTENCVSVFGFNIAFNNFLVISWWCVVATGSSMLTFIVRPHWSIMPPPQILHMKKHSMLIFIVLPHWNIMPQTLDTIQHPVTLSWHWVDQS